MLILEYIFHRKDTYVFKIDTYILNLSKIFQHDRYNEETKTDHEQQILVIII